MKSSIPGLFAALCITAVAAGAAPAATSTKAQPGTSATSAQKPLSKWQAQVLEKFKNSAPADEYFGRTKMSYLGMNNTFRDAAISAGDHTTDPGIINKVGLAEDALVAWAKKYPRDPQLARTYFLATQADRKIWTKANQERAWVYLNRLVQLFPNSFFGKTLKKDLQIGFTEHYYASPVACATPPPTPVPAPVDSGSASFYATPAPPTPEPTNPPTPAPTASPTITTVSKGLRVEVIPQACVPPASPSPSPSPTPVPSLSPAATPDGIGTALPVAPAPAPSAPAVPLPSASAVPLPSAPAVPAPAPSASPLR